MKSVIQLFCSLVLILFLCELCSAQTSREIGGATNPSRDKPELVVQLGQGSSVDEAAFSPDSLSILTANFSDSSAVLWDVATGAEIRRLQGQSEDFRAIAFSSDGRFIVTGSYNKSARLWNSATGEEIRVFKGGIGPVLEVAFSSDGNSLLTGSYAAYENGRKVAEDMVRIWDLSSGKLIRSFVVQGPIRFAPHSRFVLTGSEGNAARLIDINTGQEIKRFEGPNRVMDGGFSADGRVLFTTTGNPNDSQELRTLVLWDVATGNEIRRIEKTKGARPKLSPDGRFLLMAADDEEWGVVLIDVATGQETKRIKNVLWAVGFSPDGSLALTADSNNLRFWDLASLKPIRILKGYSSSVLSVSLSADDHYLTIGSGLSSAQLWDTRIGQQIQRYVSEKGSVDYAAVSPDGSFLFTHGFDNPGRVWNAATGEGLRNISGHLKQTEAGALSPDGRYILTGGFDNPARLWDPLTGDEIRRLSGYPGSVQYVAFSPDSRFALTLSYDKNPWRWACLWEVASGNEVRRFKVPLQMGSAVAISPDNRLLVVGGASPKYGNNANLFSLATGTHIRSFVGHARTVGSVTFSPDGRYLLSGSWDQTARLWDVATGRELRVFRGHSSMVWSATFSHDGRYVITGSTDSTTRIWRADNAQELCRLITLTNGEWFVVAPDGRFDTNNLDEIKGLNWVMPDDPFKPIPAEVFMRDYYEPRLLSRLLSGEKLRPIRSVSELNRVRPGVSIKQILWDGGHDKVSISVEVSAASAEFQRGERKVKLETGVYDLRLFRDGQQVGYAPEAGGEIKTDPVTKKAVVTFSGVKLPQQKDLTQVEFSAYAFNVDRVKSATDWRAIVYPSDLTPAKGRVFLIAVGVNAYENPDWNLKYAANDARRIQRTLSEKLSQTGDYSEVVPVSLISDYQSKDGQNIVSEKAATKANIKHVLDLLAGKPVDAEALKTIPNGDKLRAATPDDLVIISFSSHGYADQNGSFYFIPYDVGPGSKREITPELLQHCISSEELSLWLRDVDAGEMVMVVDACHSAASVQGEGFKPGPMGSRGLGQLSYDKGIRILTSTQSDDVALETDFTQQGLLTYALTHDGIDNAQADFKPHDKIITLTEWLEFGVDRVPRLYGEIEQKYQSLALNELKSIGVGQGSRTKLLIFSRDGSNSSLRKGANQQPSLFDFTRKKREVVLVR
jgi:WD40 repeat protein